MNTFQFNYIPYPLWRRRFAIGIKQLMGVISRQVYPVQEDTIPPATIEAMTRYLVRFDLLPQYDQQMIRDALADAVNLPVKVELTPDENHPAIAPNELVRLPAQWEPMEAIMVNWPILYPPLWELHAQMVEAIVPVADVHIFVPAELWAHAAYVYLKERLGDLINRVCFAVLPTDDIWIRDYGPMISYNARGERVAVKTIYDHLPTFPQSRDNGMPIRWAAHTGMPVRALVLHAEGGNFWTDGAGTFIMTEQVLEANPRYERPALEDYLHEVFDFQKLIITPRMSIERTGHVDLVAKLANANTVMISAASEWTSRKRLQAVRHVFERETNAAGERYTLFELPTPPLYFNWLVYPIRRSYTNALTVNGRILVPVYGVETDDVALKIYERAMPDYTIIPIDCKVGINGGGAVHCMTKELPILK